MKYISITVIVFLALLLSYGCDSVSDSKPVSTNPPVLTLPADNDTTQPLLPVFTWTGNADKLEISTNISFENIIHTASVTGTQYVYPGTPPLTPRTFYYWHAGVTVGGVVYWSADKFTFRTQ